MWFTLKSGAASVWKSSDSPLAEKEFHIPVRDVDRAEALREALSLLWDYKQNEILEE